MKYLRRTKDGQAIYNCPDCGCELHASKELLDYLLRDFRSKGGKMMQAKYTPEQKHERAIKAAKARWSVNGTEALSTNQ